MGRSEDRYVEYAIADWLREKRQAFGLTQREIGIAASVHHVTIFTWEASRVFPSTIARLRDWVRAHRDPETGRCCKLEITLVDTNGERHSF